MVIFSIGCSEISPTPNPPTLIPTEYLPTVIAQTVQALVSGSVTATPEWTIEDTKTPVPPRPETGTVMETATKPTEAQSTSVQITVTAVPDSNHPDEIPFAEIQFISPGALSRVVSPIKLHAFLVPGDSGRARVELFGEDGRLMFRKLFILNNSTGTQTNLRTEIDFEILGVAETATLVISVDDAYGRLKTLASEELILLSLGESDLNPPDDFLSPIVILEPKPKVLIQGGSLVVSGLVRTASGQPLLVELITTDGRVIGSRLAGVVTESESAHRLFAAEISYQVYSPTWVRVTVSERSNRLGSPVRLSSVEVLLGP